MKFSEYKQARERYCNCDCYDTHPLRQCASCEEFEEIDEPITCDVCGEDMAFAPDESEECDRACFVCGFNKKATINT